MLTSADNSGAKIIQCFHIMGGSKRKWGEIGDTIVGVIKEAEPRRLVKKHEIVKAVIVRQRKSFRRADGTYLRFDDNSVVILEGATKDPKGGRIFGTIHRELKERCFEKISNLAEEVV